MKDAELREPVSRMAASLYALEELLPPEIVQKWSDRARDVYMKGLHQR